MVSIEVGWLRDVTVPYPAKSPNPVPDAPAKEENLQQSSHAGREFYKEKKTWLAKSAPLAPFA